jgi:hypothetical protein
VCETPPDLAADEEAETEEDQYRRGDGNPDE